MDAALFMRIGLPMIMAIGGILAWRKTMKGADDDDKPGWRDTSLDDWRNERESEVEAERLARLSASKDDRKDAD